MVFWDYVIVGGGIAGLEASYQLNERFPKAKILILEAENQIGGRLLTTTELLDFKGKKYAARMGAAVFRKPDIRALNICQRFDVPLIQATGHRKVLDRRHFRFVSQIYSKDWFIERIEKWKNELETKLKNFKLSFTQFLDVVEPSEIAHEVRASLFYEDCLYQDVADVLYNYPAEELFAEVFHTEVYVPGENGWLDLLNAYKNFIDKSSKITLKLNCKVSKTTFNNGNAFEIVYEDTRSSLKTEIISNSVIFAVTLNAMKKIEMKPVCKFLDNIGSNPFVKIYASVASPVCLGELPEFYTDRNSHTHRAFTFNKDRGIIGPVDTEGEQDFKYWSLALNHPDMNIRTLLIQKQCERFWGTQCPKIKQWVAKLWTDGTHYFFPSDSTINGKNRAKFIRDYVTKPNPNVPMYFIGEMFSSKQGWTEGALESVDFLMENIGHQE